jgi:hypothetical protein
MRILSYPFTLIAAAGFILSLAAHVMALAGIRLPGGGLVWLLHVGVFVVWFPAILFGNRQFKTLQRKVNWEKMLQPCPAWMRHILKLVFAYALVNFILFILTTSGQPKPTGPAPTSVIRGFSGHWMVFYWAAFVTLYAGFKTRPTKYPAPDSTAEHLPPVRRGGQNQQIP